MTKNLLAASTCALLFLATACGSGGGEGGGETPPPSSPAAEVAECLGQEKVRAKVDKAGATLVKAPNARDAVVVRFKGNVANVLFFKSKEIAATVKEKVRNEDLTNIEQEILIVFEKAPRAAQKEQIDDCLPDEEEQQSGEEKQGGEEKQSGGQGK